MTRELYNAIRATIPTFGEMEEWAYDTAQNNDDIFEKEGIFVMDKPKLKVGAYSVERSDLCWGYGRWTADTYRSFAGYEQGLARWNTYPLATRDISLVLPAGSLYDVIDNTRGNDILEVGPDDCKCGFTLDQALLHIEKKYAPLDPHWKVKVQALARP